MVSSCAKKHNTQVADNNAIDSANMDLTVNPGDDFYQYANGAWLKNNPIPEQYSSYGNFEKLYEENLKQLRGIMDESANDLKAEKGSNKQKIGDFYASGMDTVTIEKKGIEALKTELDIIAGMQKTEDITKVFAHLNTVGISPLFYFYSEQDKKNSEMVIANTYQGSLGLPEKDYYLNPDAETKVIREKYLVHLTNMFKLMGKDEKAAAASAKSVLDLETLLAKASKSMLELRDPIANFNKTTTVELQKMMPNFNWNEYFTAVGISDPKDISIGQIEYMKACDKLLKSVSINTWKDYFSWNLLHDMAPYMHKAVVDENFNFYGKELTGRPQQQERWKRILNTTSSSLGEAVGQLYVEKYFPAKAKERMLELVGNLQKALGDRIQKLDWMSAATKAKAMEKLKAMTVKIGYPDKWLDYSKLNIDRTSFVGNVMQANNFGFKRDLNKINKPVDRTEWGMTPQTINAYYSPTMNEIVFPAAILQPPFFFMDADDAVNYAAIGTIIGHEMTHGFDDKGRLYDNKGNLTDWWTPQDADNYKKKSGPLVEQFNNFKILDSLHVDGALTIGENIADLGGITVSFEAFKSASKDTAKIKGFTPNQRFFLSYAQIWRNNIRPQQLMMYLKTDVHSPAVARVNCMIYNVPDFYTAFNIDDKAKRFIPVDKRAIVW
ncbi:MAG: M13 family metallopeptidase [Bacteroidota bacterium]